MTLIDSWVGYMMGKTLSQKTNLINRIRRYSSINGDKPAIYNKDGSSITYEEFTSSYDTVKKFIINSSIRPYHRIAIIDDSELPTALTALPVLDYSVLILLEPDLSQEYYNSIFNLLKVDYIATINDGTPVCDVAEKLGIGIINIKIKRELGLDELIIAKLPDNNLIERNKGKEDFAFIRTTSGTTSTPKVVPTTASAFMAAADRFIKGYAYSEKDITLVLTKMYKTLSFSLTMRTLCAGGTVVLAGGFNHADFLRQLTEFKVTNFSATPAILSSYTGYIEKNGVKPVATKLRFARTSGAPLSRNLKEYMEAFFKIPIDQSYGLTETTNIAGTYNAHKVYKEGSAGISTGLDVKILNGEILVRGDTVFPGYENEGIDNSIYFTGEWFHTGDLGYIDEDGYIFITGRIKEMINRGGEKISPYEVESAIMKHPGIREAAVFPYPNDYESENAGAIIVLKQEESITLAMMRNFLKDFIPAYKMPTLLYVADAIPNSKNGKIQRKQLYEILKKIYPGQEKLTKGLNKKELSDTEKKLLKIWKSTLKTKINDKNATFTDFGGDSLNGAVVLGEIENKFGVRLPVDILFDDGTLSGISGFIDNDRFKKSNFKYLVPVKASGGKSPLICVHSGIGDATTYRFIGKYMEKDRPVYALRYETRKTSWPQPLLFDYLADKYIEEIKRLYPDGPYYICGNCWGGVLAFKIASQLKKEGNDVGLLAMFDSAPKNRSKTAQRKRGKLLWRLIRTIAESIDQLRERSFSEKMYLVGRKFLNIFSLVALVQAKKIYRFAAEKNNKFLMRITRSTGALGYAYQEYKPVFYDGTIHYFKAKRGMSGKSKSYEYWKTMGRGFKIFEMDCHHNDMVIGEDARIITKKLVEIMRGLDA